MDRTNPHNGTDIGKQQDSEARATGRRAFLRVAARGTFGATLAAAVVTGPLRSLWAGVKLPSPDVKPLEGACHLPTTDEEKVVAAIVDTVVPGADSDPDGLPGAPESCALNLIYDAFYPFVQVMPALLLIVQQLSDNDYNKKFIDLDLDERTKVLQKAEETLPLIRLAYRFIRSAFYASTYNYRGGNYLRWPGPNLGYTDHPEFSFGKAVSKELTRDGNLP